MTQPVRLFFPLTNGTAFIGMRQRDTQEWSAANAQYVLATDYLALEAERDQLAARVTTTDALIDELIAAQNAVAFAASLDATRKGTAQIQAETNLRQAKAIIALCSYRAALATQEAG